MVIVRGAMPAVRREEGALPIDPDLGRVASRFLGQSVDHLQLAQLDVHGEISGSCREGFGLVDLGRATTAALWSQVTACSAFAAALMIALESPFRIFSQWST